VVQVHYDSGTPKRQLKRDSQLVKVVQQRRHVVNISWINQSINLFAQNKVSAVHSEYNYTGKPDNKAKCTKYYPTIM